MTAYYVTLPNGKKTGLGTYVAAWKTIKGLAPNASVKGFFDFPDTADRVLAAMRYGIDDRINLRGKLDVSDKAMNSSRLNRELSRTVKCECRWCGRPIPAYVAKERRFCSARCRADYNN